MTTNDISKLSEAISTTDVQIRLANDYSSMYSKDIALTIGYLFGVWKEKLNSIINNEKEFNKAIKLLESNQTAVIIRALCNIRSNLMLGFKCVSQRIRIEEDSYVPVDKLEWFEEDFKTLNGENIIVNDGSGDIIKYIENANREIIKRIDSIKNLFPDWVNFDYISSLFYMPVNTKNEMKKFQCNQNYYPFKRYFNWKNPKSVGNILENDLKILEIIYENNNSYFSLREKVVDASIWLKDNIKGFLTRGNKTCIFVDGENCDPYRFVSMLSSLEDYEITKVDKIKVFYDNKYSNCAWKILNEYSNGIEVEAIGIERIIENKSLVDHKLTESVTEEVYKNGVDSVIIASSDSDFWIIAEEVDANCLFMIEHEKSGRDFRDLLRKKGILYCFLDRFKEPEKNAFFYAVFRQELKNEISKSFSLGNSKELLKNVVKKTRKQITSAEFDSLYENYIKKLKLSIDFNGNFKVDIPA